MQTSITESSTTRLSRSKQLSLEKRHQAEERAKQNEYIKGIISKLYEKKLENEGKLPHQETQATIDKLECHSIQMNRCQVQYCLQVHAASLAQKLQMKSLYLII